MKTHKLGWANGTIYEHDDGTASYRAPAKILDSFRVRISDVVGFSESRGGRKALQNTLHIVGRGGELASCDINAGTTPKIEKWFRAHPDFGGGGKKARGSSAGESASVADELAKLAALRDSGILSDAEFRMQKERLLE